MAREFPLLLEFEILDNPSCALMWGFKHPCRMARDETDEEFGAFAPIDYLHSRPSTRGFLQTFPDPFLLPSWHFHIIAKDQTN